MKPLTKALLLSALVYPGTGHFVFKKHKTAIALITFFSCGLYFFITKILNQIQFLVDKVKSGEVALTAEAISAALKQQPIVIDPQLYSIVSYALLLCWIIGIVDLYRIR